MLQKPLQRKASENPPQCSRAEEVSPKRGRTAQVEGDATLFVHHHPRHLCPNHRRQSFPKENPWREVGRTFFLIFSLINSKIIEKNNTASILDLLTTTSTAFSGSTMDIASPVTHSALDFFEKPSVLINYEGSYDQEVFPHVGCRGPQLDFFITAEAKNLIDLNRILLSLKVGIYTEDGKTRAKVYEHPVVFSNNTLHTLFSHAELYLNGKLISHSNNCYLHSAFIETELTTDRGKRDLGQMSGIYLFGTNKSRINRLINFTPTLIAKKNARQSSTVHYILTFWNAKNFWYPESLVICVFFDLLTLHCFYWNEHLMRRKLSMAKYNQSLRKLLYSSEKWWSRTVWICLLKKLY